jgi:dCTP deaminase
MILSNRSIHKALDEGRLIIDLEPKPREAMAGGDDCPYQTSAVDLRLGNEISRFRDKLPINVDLTRGGFADLFGPNSVTTMITEDHPFVLEPHHFLLAKTFERVALPLQEGDGCCLAARVEGKSSYARCGLLVHFTAPTIHAGFDGTITLELFNLGPLAITLRPQTPICQLIIEKVDGIPFRNDSQFQGQNKAGGKVG